MPQPAATRFSATIAALARPRDVRALRLPVLHAVMSLRLCTLFERAGREPVSELSTRFGSVTAAVAVLELARTVARCWPESYLAGRPCCMAMTPDETTLAAMARAAADADRAGFARALDGFVPAGLHAALFEAVLGCVTELPQA